MPSNSSFAGASSRPRVTPIALVPSSTICVRFSLKLPPRSPSSSQKSATTTSHSCAIPHSIRRTFASTNAIETVDGQLERMRRNNGGYFHSGNVVKLKLGITIDYLEQGTWRRPAATTRSALHQLNVMFEQEIESEE